MVNSTCISNVSKRNNSFFRYLGILVFLIGISVNLSWGQTTYGWDGTNINATSGTNANITSAAFGASQVNNNGTTTLISTTSASSGYTGSSGTSNFGAACKTGALSTSTSTYFTATITPSSNYKIALNSISLGSRGTSTGPTAITIYSSIDNYTTAIGTATISANSTWALSNITFSGASLTGLANTAVTLRIYGSGGTGTASANTANWRIDDISLSVTPQAAITTYTVLYNPNSGSGTITDGSSPYNSGVTVTVLSNSFIKTGYTFTGWNTAAGGGGTAYSPAATFAIAANTTLYAQWTANNNTVTFDGNSNTGGSMSDQTIATDATVSLTGIGYTKTGYTFAGWATSAGGSVVYANGASYTMGTSNVTLFAKWTANNNTITFNGNGNTGGSMSAQTIATDASANLSTNLFTKTGYSFNGWNTASDGTGTSYADGVSYSMGTSNVTLYALWSVISTPTITVTGSLSAVSTTYGTASSATSVSISGSALSSDILVTPPAGFEVSQTSGGASGYAATQTLTQAAGIVASTTVYVRLAATSTPATYSGNIVLTSGITTDNVATIASTVSTKQLNISGLSISATKVYDATTSAVVSGTPSLLTSIDAGLSVSSDGKPITGDEVILSGTASGVYNSKDVTSATTVTVTGLSLTGAQSAYYTLNEGSAAATITAKSLSMSGLSVPASKTYNGNTTAVVSGTATLSTEESAGAGTTDDGKPYTGDIVSITGTATGIYNDANVDNATTVTFGGLSLTGAQAGNYSLTIQGTQAATITKANQSITLAATATKYVGDADYSLAATSATSGTNALSYSSSDPAVATINASTGLVHILTVGTTTITVSQAGSANYNAATDATQTLTVSTAPTLLLTEDFNYTTGDLLTAHGWTAHSSAGSQAIDVAAAPGLSINGYVGGGIGGAAKVDNTGEDVNKSFTAKTSGILYVASIIQINANTTAGYFYHLGPNVIGSTFFSRVWVNSSANGVNITTGSTAPSSYLSVTNGSPFVLVLKHNFTTNKTDMFILSSFPATEPVTPDATIDETLAEIGSVALRQYNASQNILVDGIRVTTSWSDLPITFSGTGDWSEIARWNSAIVPGTTQNVVVDGAATISSNVQIAGLTVNAGKSLTLTAGKQLTTSTSLTNNGTLNLLSDATATATILTPTSISGTGTANVEQYLTSGRNWYISSPVTGATSAAIAATTSNTLVGYNEADGTWPSAGTTLSVGKGYIAVSPTTSAPVTFSGTLNTGSQSFSLNRTDSAVVKRGFNLVGNPYPSYLNWESATRTSVGPTMWYRTKDAGVYVFATYGAVSQIGTSLGGTPVTKYIPPMQAFWVRVSGAGTGTLAFDNTMRSHSATSNLLKAPEVTAQQVLRLQVSNGENKDEAIVLFNDKASNGYDDYDSPKMTNANVAIPEIYTMAGTEQLVINGLNSITANQELPLGFKTGQSNLFTIKATEISNFDPSMKVILRDNTLATEQELTDGSTYSFTSDVATTTTRFSVLFKSAGVTTGLNNLENQVAYIYKNANNQISVSLKGDLSNEAYVTVYNAVGQKLHTEQITNTNAVLGTPFTAGIYLVTVNNGGKSVTKKVILN